MSGLTRGPLAAEVYWRRRLLLIGLALLLVLGLSRVLGGGGDASDPGRGTAAQAGAVASTTPTATSSTPSTPSASGPATPVPSTKKEIRQAKRAAKKAAKAAAAQAAAEAAAKAAAALPEPLGPCGDTDVVITPTVPSPVAGSDVTIALDLRTRFSPACTWTVSPDTLALKVTSGDENIWSVQECPGTVPTQDVVLRRAVPTNVQVVWSGKRSDDTCSGRTDWALPGYYHVLVAALAGEPTDVQFELTAPSAPVVVKTEKPKPTKAKNGKKKNG